MHAHAQSPVLDVWKVGALPVAIGLFARCHDLFDQLLVLVVLGHEVVLCLPLVLVLEGLVVVLVALLRDFDISPVLARPDPQLKELQALYL
eukprot:12177679-Alexandrium_andersonii.AAC.1